MEKESDTFSHNNSLYRTHKSIHKIYIWKMCIRDRIKIKVDDFELRLIIRALAEWRNILIAENKPTEDLDELLIRFCK